MKEKDWCINNKNPRKELELGELTLDENSWEYRVSQETKET